MCGESGGSFVRGWVGVGEVYGGVERVVLAGGNEVGGEDGEDEGQGRDPCVF